MGLLQPPVDPRNMWGTLLADINPAEYCPHCEREVPKHYRLCPASAAHTCRTQCDNCHTLENCVPATIRHGELTLCARCYLDRNHP